ncbi:hypothetical protein ACQJBY_042217 [Aegilops geniculata]
MSLRRLLSFSATVSGRLPLRRCLSTAAASHPPWPRSPSTAASSNPSRRHSLPTVAASHPPWRRPLSTAAPKHPPWAMIDYNSLVDESSAAPGACFGPVEPPLVSRITAPAHLLNPRERPAADSSVIQLVTGHVNAASGDGHLLLTYYDILGEGPRESWNGNADVEAERCICNPISGEVLRLPYPGGPGGSRKNLGHRHMGLLTQAGGGCGHGPPDRFAVADIVSQRDRIVDRFLPEVGRWDLLLGVPCRPPLAWEMEMDQETVAFAGRLWWVDLTCGAVSMDPFSNQPELRFVPLPNGTSLTFILMEHKDSSAEHLAQFRREVAKYRRIGVSEGRLRFVDASIHDPFLLSSYVLDDEGRSWTLEHQVELRKVLEDGGHPCEQGKRPPQIAVIDPLNADIIYITVGEQKHIVAVDIYQEKVIASSPLQNQYHSLVPCVLPPWLGSSQIPTAGTVSMPSEWPLGYNQHRPRNDSSEKVLKVADGRLVLS